jgi:uncharacterized protein YegJ (DUF2314 family)
VQRREEMGKIIIISMALMLIFVGCTQKVDKETRGDETVIGVSTEDMEMNKIMEDARTTIADFIEIIDDTSIDPYSRSVKFPFETDAGSVNQIEHIWITAITKENNKYYGIVANDPFYIKSMKLGDKIEFDINKVSDWKYVKDGYLIGGKSIKYFYDRMSEEEKKQFDKESGVKFKG